MRRTTAASASLGILLIVVLTGGLNGQHTGGWPTPPSPAVRDVPTVPRPPKRYANFDSVTMEREAKEMSALAASIPDDIEQLKRGFLPSDAIDKLKRIEKLSKQLRAQIRP